MTSESLWGSLLNIESIRQRRSRSASMKDVATLPPIVGSRLLAELEAEGIPAGSSDMAPGSLGAIPGLAMPSMTVWVEELDGGLLGERPALGLTTPRRTT